MKNKIYTKYLTILLFLFSMHSISFAQNPIKGLRYLDDNKAIKSDSLDFKVHRNIKVISLHNSHRNTNLSIGGETRQRYIYYHNPEFGDATVVDKNGFLLQRYMLHLDANFGNHFRLFSQFTSNFVSNKDIPYTPDIDINKLDLFQLFIDLKYNFILTMNLKHVIILLQ